MPELKTLYSSLIQTASNDPEKTALVTSSKKITYHELLLKIDRTVDMLWSLGIRPGDKAAIALRNSPEFVIINFALTKIGAAAVPINFLISKKDEIEYILSHSEVKIIITQKEFLKPYLRLKEKLPHITNIISIDSKKEGVLNFETAVDKYSYQAAAHTVKVAQDDICTILYTSGTTGNPKGVSLTHQNLITNAYACIDALHIKNKDVFLCVLPMFHTFAWTAAVIVPLILGSKIVIVSHITPAAKWLNLMGKEKVSVMAAVPQLFSVLSKEAKGLKKFYLQYWAFRKVRFCFSGAAPLSETVLNHFERKMKIPLLEGYGLTETSPVVSVNRANDRKAGSVGKPVNNVSVKIIDDNHNTLDFETEGEICVKGASVTKGYYKDEKATLNSLTPDGWFKTGDIGVMDREGYIHIKDRKKDMIIIKGLKVFSVQVESVFLKHPDIEECAVIGIPHRDGEELIKCFCVLKKDAVTKRAELIQFAKKHLDGYKRPRDIEIVESLPKNALNKVLKRKLRQNCIDKLNAKIKATVQV